MTSPLCEFSESGPEHYAWARAYAHAGPRRNELINSQTHTREDRLEVRLAYAGTLTCGGSCVHITRSGARRPEHQGVTEPRQGCASLLSVGVDVRSQVDRCRTAHPGATGSQTRRRTRRDRDGWSRTRSLGRPGARSAACRRRCPWSRPAPEPAPTTFRVGGGAPCGRQRRHGRRGDFACSVARAV